MSINELEQEASRLRNDGKYQEAADKLNEILQQDEAFVRAHLALAVVFHHLEKPEESVKHGERACELEADDPFNFTALSVTYQRAFTRTNDPKFIQLAEEAKYKADSMRLQQG